MGVELSELVAEVRRASSALDQCDARMHKRVDGIEQSVNDLFRRLSRPGSAITADDSEVAERKSATEWCIAKHELATPKNDGNRPDYLPSSTEIDEALNARRGFRHLFRHGDPARLDQLERKSLTSFSFGTNSFMLPPEMSATTLRCIVDDTDISGQVNNVTISAPSIKFPIDNTRMEAAAWACEASCFANNPAPDLQEGLGELEIKAESLRYIVCAGSCPRLAHAAFPHPRRDLDGRD